MSNTNFVPIKDRIIESLQAVEGITPELLAKVADTVKPVFDAELGKIHGDYDRDFQEATGIEKPAGAKSYQFWKEQMATLKKQAEEVGGGLKLQIDALKEENATLQAQVKAGKGGEALKQQLADQESLVKQLQKKLEAEKAEYANKLQEAEQQNKHLRISHEFDRALTGVLFKSEKVIPVDVRETYVETVKSNILSQYQPDWESDGQGGKKLVFRKDGDIVRDPATMRPLTPGDLLTKALEKILDTGKQAEGAGTGPSSNGQPPATISLAGAANQVQAYEAIHNSLLARGLATATQEYQQEFDKAWTENNVSSLPAK